MARPSCIFSLAWSIWGLILSLKVIAGGRGAQESGGQSTSQTAGVWR